MKVWPFVNFMILMGFLLNLNDCLQFKSSLKENKSDCDKILTNHPAEGPYNCIVFLFLSVG